MSAKTGKVLVTIPFTQQQKDLIAASAKEMEVIFKNSAEVTEQDTKEAEVIMGNLPAHLVTAAENLKWLQLNSAGCDPFCNPGVMNEAAVLTNASGAYDISVAEHMVACTMNVMKKLYAYHENQKQNLWKDEGPVMAAYGSTILILGLGNIGLHYAKIMKAMGSYVIGIKRSAGNVPEGVDEVHTMAELNECLSRADIVMSVLPGTPETNHIIGREQFVAMKESAYFINVGRGNAVDETALYEALEADEIAGAMLDVTEVEPLPAESPLWNAKNLHLTPHIAGGFHIPVTLQRIAGICAENLKRYEAGEELTCVVNRALRY